MKGFTLIELLVVVLIIGILSAVALPQYQKAVNKSKTVEAIETLAFVEREAQIYYLANGTVNHAFYNDLELPALKYFQLGSIAGNSDGADSFFALQSKNGEIAVTSHFVNGVSHRYCSGKCKLYFTEENCEDSTLTYNLSNVSSAKCKLK